MRGVSLAHELETHSTVQEILRGAQPASHCAHQEKDFDDGLAGVDGAAEGHKGVESFLLTSDGFLRSSPVKVIRRVDDLHKLREVLRRIFCCESFGELVLSLAAEFLLLSDSEAVALRARQYPDTRAQITEGRQLGFRQRAAP